MAPGTEFADDFCAGIGIVLVFFIVRIGTDPEKITLIQISNMFHISLFLLL